MISNRLKMVADYVENCDFLADIGSDHGYIPIYLFKKGIIKRGAACDISEGSVLKAKLNIIEAGCQDYIEARCKAGLKAVYDNENPDTIIMSGMGGMLMIDIMKDDIEVLYRSKRIILQPQRDIETVRRYIHSIGFKIIEENMIFEYGKYYNVIVCEKGIDVKYTKAEYMFGKILISRKNKYLKQYIHIEVNKIYNIISRLNSKDNHIAKRRKHFEDMSELYEEVLECL